MNEKKPSPSYTKDVNPAENSASSAENPLPTALPDEEIGGYKALGLPEPTRYKDWEVKGRCSDF